MKRKFFSLIELLIVIVIIGALAVMIMPKFMDLETTAKDNACDYNNAGIARYIQMFRSVNGVYPSGFHTGMQTAAAADGDISVQNADGASAMAKVTQLNIEESTTPLSGDGYFRSLANAGIVSLAYATENAVSFGNNLSAPAVVPRAVKQGGDWYETLTLDGTARDESTAPVSINGYALSEWYEAGMDPAQSTDTARKLNREKKEFRVVPLFVASTVDWDYAVRNGSEYESQVGIETPAKCPWLNSGTFRYYICFFKVYANGDPARFLASACPECGVLDADTF